MPEAIERFEFQDFVSFRIGGDDLFDRENLHGAAAARIGRDHIFGVSLIEANGLGSMREKIDGRRTTQAECFLGNVELESLLALAAFESRNQEDHLDTRTETRGAKLIETLQIDKEEFFWEMKILLKEAVAGKRAARIGQESFGIGESGRLEMSAGK